MGLIEIGYVAICVHIKVHDVCMRWKKLETLAYCTVQSKLETNFIAICNTDWDIKKYFFLFFSFKKRGQLIRFHFLSVSKNLVRNFFCCCSTISIDRKGIICCYLLAVVKLSVVLYTPSQFKLHPVRSQTTSQQKKCGKEFVEKEEQAKECVKSCKLQTKFSIF